MTRSAPDSRYRPDHVADSAARENRPLFGARLLTRYHLNRYHSDLSLSDLQYLIVAMLIKVKVSTPPIQLCSLAVSLDAYDVRHRAYIDAHWKGGDRCHHRLFWVT